MLPGIMIAGILMTFPLIPVAFSESVKTGLLITLYGAFLILMGWVGILSQKCVLDFCEPTNRKTLSEYTICVESKYNFIVGSMWRIFGKSMCATTSDCQLSIKLIKIGRCFTVLYPLFVASLLFIGEMQK